MRPKKPDDATAPVPLEASDESDRKGRHGAEAVIDFLRTKGLRGQSKSSGARECLREQVRPLRVNEHVCRSGIFPLLLQAVDKAARSEINTGMR